MRYRDGTLKIFDVPGVSLAGTSPIAINSACEITGYYYDSKFIARGFLRDPNGTITVFDAPGAGDTPYQQGTFPVGINDRGVVIGFFVDKQLSTHGFIRWPDGKFTVFDVAPELGGETAATSINSEGTIAGVFQGKDAQNQGFVRTADGQFSYFKSLDGTTISDYSNPDRPSINRAGTVAGWYSLNGMTMLRGFARTANGDFEEINAPGATATFVHGINAAGEIAGFFETTSRHTADFIRRRDGHFVIFEPPGSTETQATDINDKGNVVGWYTATSETRGFLATFR